MFWEKVNYSAEDIKKDREYSRSCYSLPTNNQFYLRKFNNKLYVVDSINKQQFYFRDCTSNKGQSSKTLKERISALYEGNNGGAYRKESKVFKTKTISASNETILNTIVKLHNEGIKTIVLGLKKNNLKNKYILFSSQSSDQNKNVYEVQAFIPGHPIDISPEFAALNLIEKQRICDEFVFEIKKLNNMGMLHTDLCTDAKSLMTGNILYNPETKSLFAIDCEGLFYRYYSPVTKKPDGLFQHLFNWNIPNQMHEHRILQKALHANLHLFTKEANSERFAKQQNNNDRKIHFVENK